MHIHTCIYISPQLVHARLCNGAAASLPWKLLRTYLESCANIVQAVVSARPPSPLSSRPPSCWPVDRPVRLRNPFKSTLAHDAVAAVVLHKHHLMLVRASSSLSMVHTRAWPRISPSTKIYFRCHFRGVFPTMLTNVVCGSGRATTTEDGRKQPARALQSEWRGVL